MEPRSLRCIFSFFKDAMLVNDEDNEPQKEYGCRSSLQDRLEEFYVFLM